MGELNQETVVLIVNAIFAFFVTVGVLFGLSRGAKKSALRFAFISVIGITMYFAAPYLSALLLKIDFSSLVNFSVDIGGTSHQFTTLEDLLQTFINSNAQLEAFVEANQSFEVIVEQLPAIVTNLVIFLVGFWVLKILTWPMYAIMAIKYGRRGEDGERPKKHRFVGLLIGGLQGVVIALIVFMPVAGLSSVLTAEGTDGSSLLSVFSEDAANYVSVYEDSAVGSIGGIADIDETMFDGITTIKVEGSNGETIKIKPRQEMRTTLEIGADIQRIVEMFEDIQAGNSDEVDWVLIENVVDRVFDLNTLEVVLEEYAPYLINQTLTNEDYGVKQELEEAVDELPAAEDIKEFLSIFSTSFDEATIARYKSDVLSLVEIGKALDEHNVLSLVFQAMREEITQEVMVEAIFEEFGSNRDLSYDVITGVLSSQTLRSLMPAGANVVLGYAEHIINENSQEEVAITRIDANEIDWEQEANVYTDIVYNLLSFAYDIDPFNLDGVDTIDLITSLDLSNLGEAMNSLRSSQIYGTIYSSIIEGLLKMDVVTNVTAQYFDTNELISELDNLDWVAEFNIVEDLINLYVMVEDFDNINNEELTDIIADLENSELLDMAIDGAAKYLFIEVLGEDIGQIEDGEFVFNSEFEWLSYLSLHSISSNAQFFTDIIELAVSMVDSGIENLNSENLSSLAEAVETLGDTTDLTQEEIVELEEFKTFFNGAIQYAMSKSGVDLVWLEGVNIDDLIENMDVIVEFANAAIAVQEGNLADYTPEQVEALADAIAGLDNMSEEMQATFEGMLNDLLGDQLPFENGIDFDNIDFAEESEMIESALNIYIAFENEAGQTELETAIESFVDEMQQSAVVNEMLTDIIVQVAGEGVPEWVEDVDMTWVSDNEGLVEELVELALWTQNNDLEDITNEQASQLQAEIANIPDIPKYEEFATYMQGLLSSL